MKSNEFIVESSDDEWSGTAAWRTDPTAQPPKADPGFHWVIRNGSWAQEESAPESPDDGEWSMTAAWRTDPTVRPPKADPGFHWVRLKNGGWAQEENAPGPTPGVEILRQNPAYRKALGLPPLEYDLDVPQKAKDAATVDEPSIDDVKDTQLDIGADSEKNNKRPRRPSQSADKPYSGSAGARAIQKANPGITDVNKIRVGSTIKIPGRPDYTIQRGDTLDKIAARMIKEESDVNRILTLSGLKSSEFLNETPAVPAAPAPTATATAPVEPANPTMTSRTIGAPELSTDPVQNFKAGVQDAKEFYDLARKAGVPVSDAIPMAYAKGQATATGDIGSFVAAVTDKATGTAEKGLSQLQSTIKDYADLYTQFQPTSEYYKKNIAPNPQLKAQADEFIRTNLTPQQYAQSIQQAQAQLKSPRAMPTAASATVPGNPASQPPAAPANETAELDRILKLSGMEFIAEDATATQQFVGTGSSRDWSMSETLATTNATRQMIKQKYGNNPPPGNGIELRYYNKQKQTIADPAKPGNYLTTVTFTPIESKLSPAISVKPSMDPIQDFDYFYNGQQVKPGDPFFDRIKQIHLSLGAAPAEPAITNETAELSRLSKLISEDSTKSITVQRGDTLGRIAQDNSTTVAAIVKLNNIANPDRIYPGDVIKIPGGQGDPGGRTKRQGLPSAPDTDSDPDHTSRVERALLNMIAGRESSDDYNAINYKARAALKKGTMQITGEPGHHPFEGQSGVTAAGRYQMLWNTWKTAAKLAGVDPADFSPNNQDRAAIALAKNEYQRKYNRDLIADLQDPKRVEQAIQGSTGPWSVKAGGPGFTTQHYVSALSDIQAA